VNKLDELLLHHLFGPLAPTDTLRTSLRTAWRRTLMRLSPLGRVTHSNRVHLFTDGDSAFEDMLASIDAAASRIWLETYIFEADGLGARFRDALVRAASRGVEVRLLYDAFGSGSLPSGYFAPLVEVGGKAVAYNPLFRRRSEASYLNRDHRKILVVDDRVGFAGGMNISEDYAGERLGNGRFRDTHARLEGPSVEDLATIFAESWRRASGEALVVRREPSPDEIKPVFVQVLSSDLRNERKKIQRALRHTVSRAGRRCFLTSAYFVPPLRLIRALRLAARRGVDVRVLTAGRSDVPLSRHASWHLYARLLKAGVRIFEMKGRTLHAKTATIDGVYGMVGSFNLDLWSHRRLLEVTVTLLDPEKADEIEGDFHQDLEISDEVRLEDLEHRPLYLRFVSWVAYQIIRL